MTTILDEAGLRKHLREEREIVCLTPQSYADTLAVALSMTHAGQMVECKITKGYK
jgi:hypothetical protein